MLVVYISLLRLLVSGVRAQVDGAAVPGAADADGGL
jgi:hypothetical protein